MKNIFCFILFSVIANPFFAQQQDSLVGDRKPLGFKKNVFYVEGLGNAGIGVYSINYERNAGNNKNGFATIRIGCSRLYAEKGEGINVPILINQVFDNSPNHHFELGGGMSVAFGNNASYAFGVTANLMYRFQKPGGRFMFRAGWTPVYYIGETSPFVIVAFLLYPGAGIGYVF